MKVNMNEERLTEVGRCERIAVRRWTALGKSNLTSFSWSTFVCCETSSTVVEWRTCYTSNEPLLLLVHAISVVGRRTFYSYVQAAILETVKNKNSINT